MKKQRKHCTPEEKVAILRRHLLEQVPISELCDKHGLQPTELSETDECPQNARYACSIGTQPVSPAVYGVNAPL